jgi:hypothetical protein
VQEFAKAIPSKSQAGMSNIRWGFEIFSRLLPASVDSEDDLRPWCDDFSF